MIQRRQAEEPGFKKSDLCGRRKSLLSPAAHSLLSSPEHISEREAGTQSAAACDATTCALHAGRISHKEDVRMGKKKFKEGIFQQSGDMVGIPQCDGLRVCVCMLHSPYKATDNNDGLLSCCTITYSVQSS